MDRHRMRHAPAANQPMDFPLGWKCDRVIVKLERYLTLSLPRAELLAVAEHIEACAWCAQEVMLLQVTVSQHTVELQ